MFRVMRMPKTYTISKEQTSEIEALRKTKTDKRVDKRLRAIQLRGEGFKNPEIANKLDTSPKVVSRWISAYLNEGIEALTESKYCGNHRNISLTEETEFLAEFKMLAEKGQIVEVGAIKAAYEAKVGHTIGGSQVHYLLSRHGWRKVVPRSKHPNRAGDEEIASSKKLKLESVN